LHIGLAHFGHEHLTTSCNLGFRRETISACSVPERSAAPVQIDGLDDPELVFALAASALARQLDTRIVARADNVNLSRRSRPRRIIASGNSFASERTLDRRIFVDNVLRTRRNGHGAQRDCNGNGCIAHPHFGHGFLRVN